MVHARRAVAAQLYHYIPPLFFGSHDNGSWTDGGGDGVKKDNEYRGKYKENLSKVQKTCLPLPSVCERLDISSCRPS